MIGGMVSSTVLTLLVIPAVYALVKGAGLPRSTRTGAARPETINPEPVKALVLQLPQTAQ
jgi:hypothetical protein